MKLSIALCVELGAAAVLLGATRSDATAADPYSVIYRFQSPADGKGPVGGFSIDADGTLYGATFSGGNKSDCGTVYSLTKPTGDGAQWTHKIIRYLGGGDRGCHPAGTPLIDNNFVYGATRGTLTESDYGSIFRTGKSGAGYKTLHAFKSAADGSPNSSLIFGPNGVLFGTTYDGGTVSKCDVNGAGALFRVGSGGGGFSVVHQFGQVDSGSHPSGGLAFGPDGSLYGNTYDRCIHNGDVGSGVVFRRAGGYSVLASFPGTAFRFSVRPSGPLAFGPDGTIYGTAVSVRKTPTTAWALTPGAPGQPWTLTTLYQFQPRTDGYSPRGLVRDDAGNLYGTLGNGVLYRLSPPAAGGTWTFTRLHKWTDTDYVAPPLLSGSSLFGVLYYGGINKLGTVFQYKLP